MKKIIIFGIKDFAELAHWYLEHDSEYEVEAFTVNRNYIVNNEFRGLPVVPFEEILQHYPPEDYALFAPMAPNKMNKLRENIYNAGKQKGYQFISYISSNATICDNEIGENCLILEDNTLQPFTKIGNNVVLWSGNHIGHHSLIRDHVFFTSHVVMSGHCIIEPNCFLGVNATIRDGAHLAKGTLLAMGACLIAQETENWCVYVGNPAKKKGDKPSFEIY